MYTDKHFPYIGEGKQLIFPPRLKDGNRNAWLNVELMSESKRNARPC